MITSFFRGLSLYYVVDTDVNRRMAEATYNVRDMDKVLFLFNLL